MWTYDIYLKACEREVLAAAGCMAAARAGFWRSLAMKPLLSNELWPFKLFCWFLKVNLNYKYGVL